MNKTQTISRNAKHTPREILFRGKRVDNGEWVEGSLIKHLNGRSYIFPIAASITKCCALYEKVINPTYEVIPSSVGQYIGLDDKNGKKMFTGMRGIEDNAPDGEINHGILALNKKEMMFGFVLSQGQGLAGESWTWFEEVAPEELVVHD